MPDTREQLLLSLLAWAVFIVLYGITKWRGGSVDSDPDDGTAIAAQRATTEGAVPLP